LFLGKTGNKIPAHKTEVQHREQNVKAQSLTGQAKQK